MKNEEVTTRFDSLFWKMHRVDTMAYVLSSSPNRMLLLCQEVPEVTMQLQEAMTNRNPAKEMQQQVFTRRNLLNLILTSATLSTIATTTPQPAQAFFGVPTKEGPKPAIASDITGTPILYQQFLSKHKPNEQIMV